MQDRLRLAVLAQEVETELEVRALEVAVDGLADVVQEGGPGRDVGVEAELLGHDPGQERDLFRVVQHVLAVAGAELEASHQPQHLGMEIVEPELEGGRFALVADGLLHVALDLLHDFFDAGRVNAAVGDQPFDRLARDLPAQRIEARKDDGARRVVDDQLDAGRGLERADVAPFAADDPALEIVARKVHDRDGRLDGMLGGAALDGVGDDLLGPNRRRFSRLGLQALDEVGGVAPRVALQLPQQQLPRLVGRSARPRAGARGGVPRAAPRSLPCSPSRLLPARQHAFAAAQILLEPVRLRSAGRRGRASCPRAAVPA